MTEVHTEVVTTITKTITIDERQVEKILLDHFKFSGGTVVWVEPTDNHDCTLRLVERQVEED